MMPSAARPEKHPVRLAVTIAVAVAVAEAATEFALGLAREKLEAWARAHLRKRNAK
jgi:hypothetical protein